MSGHVSTVLTCQNCGQRNRTPEADQMAAALARRATVVCGRCKMNLLPEDTSVDDECDACGAMKSWDGSAWVCGHCTCDQCGKDADDCECDGGVQ